MTTQAQTRWTEGKRSDGLAIVPGIDGLVIMPAGERLPVAECPCCGKPFLNIRAAQLVADMMYPMAKDS